MTLLVGTGLFATSFLRVTSIDIGLDYSHLLAFHVRADTPRGNVDGTERAQAQIRDLIARVRAIPGVADAAVMQGGTPLTGGASGYRLTVPGRGGAGDIVDSPKGHTVTPGTSLRSTRGSSPAGRSPTPTGRARRRSS